MTEIQEKRLQAIKEKLEKDVSLLQEVRLLAEEIVREDERPTLRLQAMAMGLWSPTDAFTVFVDLYTGTPLYDNAKLHTLLCWEKQLEPVSMIRELESLRQIFAELRRRRAISAA